MMKNFLFSLLFMGSATNNIFSSEQTNPNHDKDNPIDVRIFLEEQPCNQKNAAGHTFLYQVALECAQYNEWRPLGDRIERYVNNSSLK